MGVMKILLVKQNAIMWYVSMNTRILDVCQNVPRHLADHVDDEVHVFTWGIFRNVPSQRVVREIVEAFYIRTSKPSLNTDVKLY